MPDLQRLTWGSYCPADGLPGSRLPAGLTALRCLAAPALLLMHSSEQLAAAKQLQCVAVFDRSVDGVLLIGPSCPRPDPGRLVAWLHKVVAEHPSLIRLLLGTCRHWKGDKPPAEGCACTAVDALVQQRPSLTVNIVSCWASYGLSTYDKVFD